MARLFFCKRHRAGQQRSIGFFTAQEKVLQWANRQCNLLARRISLCERFRLTRLSRGEVVSINVQCPGCRKSLKGPADLCGKNVKCPGCGQQFVIAAPSPVSVEPVLLSVDSAATEPPRETASRSGLSARLPVPPTPPTRAHRESLSRQQLDGSAQSSNGCPICHAHTDGKPLRLVYDEYACRRCRNSLINRRAVAWILDMVFLWIGTYALGFMLGIVLVLGNPNVEAEFAAASGMLVGLMFSVFYLTKDAWFGGRSLGKRLCGLKVIDRVSLRPVGMGASFMRNLPLMIPFVPFVAAVQLNSDDCHRVGEGWANTMVTFAPART